MPDGYDERGEPIGTEPVQETMGPPAQEMPQPPPQQAQPQTERAPFLSPSFRGRTDVMPDSMGGMVVPGGGSDAGPSPADLRDRTRYLDQMAQAGRLDEAQKSVDQAMRFLGMRGVEKDVESGTPYAQALAKHLPYISWNNPAQAAAYSKIIAASQPPPPLSMQTLEGVRVLRTPKGDRIVPQSAIPQLPVTSAQTIPFTDPDTGEPVPGYFATPSPGGRGSTIHKRTDMEPQMTSTEHRHQLEGAIKRKAAQIDRLIRPPAKEKEEHAKWKSEVGRINAEIAQLEAQFPNLTQKKANYTHFPDRKIGDTRKLPGSNKHPAGIYKWMGDEKGWIRQE